MGWRWGQDGGSVYIQGKGEWAWDDDEVMYIRRHACMRKGGNLEPWLYCGRLSYYHRLSLHRASMNRSVYAIISTTFMKYEISVAIPRLIIRSI